MCALASYLHWARDNLGSTQWLKMTINLAFLKKSDFSGTFSTTVLLVIVGKQLCMREVSLSGQ